MWSDKLKHVTSNKSFPGSNRCSVSTLASQIHSPPHASSHYFPVIASSMSMHAVVSLFKANVNMCDQVATKSLFVMSNTPE